MKQLFFTSILIFSLFISCKKGKNNPESCNGSSTRRDIKILIDEQTKNIDTTPVIISVKDIGELDVIEAKKDTERQPAEKKVYAITAKVDKVSKHRDGDWKVKLTDGDKYINCEFPNMGCEYIKGSSFYNQMNESRCWIEQNEEDLVGKTVTIVGVGFIDIDHKFPRKNADNEMEIHPVLNIHF